MISILRTHQKVFQEERECTYFPLSHRHVKEPFKKKAHARLNKMSFIVRMLTKEPFKKKEHTRPY